MEGERDRGRGRFVACTLPLRLLERPGLVLLDERGRGVEGRAVDGMTTFSRSFLPSFPKPFVLEPEAWALLLLGERDRVLDLPFLPPAAALVEGPIDPEDVPPS